MSNITPKQYAEALYLALNESSTDSHEQVALNLEKIMKHNGDFDQYSKVVDELELMYSNAPKNEVTVTEVNQVIEDNEIMEIMNFQAQETLIDREKDSDLIGGVIIRTESEQLDLSIRSKLASLRSSIIK